MPLNLTPTEQLLYSTMRITVLNPNGTPASYGTGFVMDMSTNKSVQMPCLVTNNHVLPPTEFPLVKLTFHTRTEDENNPIGEKSISTICHPPVIFRHPNPEVDLCAFPLLPISNQLPEPILCVTLTTDLIPSSNKRFDAIEEVMMVGYPSALSDEVNNLPLIRRGITASPLNKDFHGKKDFVVDMACFPGSSGSPVFIYSPNGYTEHGQDGSFSHVFGPSRLMLVGVLYSGPVMKNSGEVTLTTKANFNFNTMLHLGYVIKASRLRELQQEIMKQLK